MLLEGISAPSLETVGAVGEATVLSGRSAHHQPMPIISAKTNATPVHRNLRDVRVAIGAVAPTVIRAPHVEEALEGKALDSATIAAAATAAGRDIRPISDVRASDWYRRELVHNMLERMLSHVGHG